jgi:hypothetical protein
MSSLLKAVLRQYRDSKDFNGLYFDGVQAVAREEATQLVADGLIEVVSDQDYPNPHIRPWPSKRTVQQQLDSVASLPAPYGVCLYPTPKALARTRPDRRFPGQPYRQAMAKGRGTLELAFFSFDVLEQYRNDPRFRFEFSDFGAQAVIGDEAYADERESKEDHVLLKAVGFAYDLADYDIQNSESTITRRVCTFYGDLADLSATHQQRWKTYEVEQGALEPHPVWWMQQMGHWADGTGPFEHFFTELENIRTLTNEAFGTALFRTADRPGDLGWILRPSQLEWDAFIHQFDKLLSENLATTALNAMGAPTTNASGQNLGTLNRLAAFMSSCGIADDAVSSVLKPLREVRQARQKPAHALRRNVSDRTFVHKQVAAMDRVNTSIETLRRFFQSHPANAGWEEPDYLRPDARRYRF